MKSFKTIKMYIIINNITVSKKDMRNNILRMEKVREMRTTERGIAK